MRIDPRGAHGVVFIAGNEVETALLHEVMECLPPAAELHLALSETYVKYINLVFRVQRHVLEVGSTTPEEEQLYSVLAQAIRRGGDLISARTYDDGWVAAFDVLAWRHDSPWRLAAVGGD